MGINSFFKRIFALYNDGTYKCINFLGFRIKYKNKDKFTLNEIYTKQNLLLRQLNRINQKNISTASLHQRSFLPFKCKHYGEELVIFATGPSANNYIPIKNAIHIGVNRAFQMNKVDFDYYFIQDYSGKTKEYIDELDTYRYNKCTKFYGLTTEWIYEPNRTIPETHAIKANALRYRTDWSNVPFFKSEFAYDISTQPLGCFGSVVFPALQFALWTCPKKIYLVGCDCSLSGYAYNEKEKNYLIPNELINAYKSFRNFAQKYYPDIEIISINPVGLKGIFTDIYQGEKNEE